MWELIREGKNPSHLLPATCRSTNGATAPVDPLNHQQLHLRNQSWLGLELRLNYISHSSAMLGCVTQISG